MHMLAVMLLGKANERVVVHAGHAPLRLLDLPMSVADVGREAPEATLAPPPKAAVGGVAGEAGKPVHQVNLLAPLEFAEYAVALRVVVFFEGSSVVIIFRVLVLILTIVDGFLGIF